MVKGCIHFVAYSLAIFTMCVAMALPNTKSTASLRVGLNPWIGNGLFYIAKEKGFFEREKLNVDFIKYNDGAIAKQLLSTSKIDMIPTTPETVLVLADAGIGVKVVGILNTSKGADGIIANRDIKNLTDLRDKTIAFEIGSSSHLLLSYFLAQENLSLKDVKPINLSAAESATAFVAHKVDAAVTWEPWLSKAATRKGGHVLIDSKALELFPDFYIFRENIVKEQPTAIKALLRALFASLTFIQEHPKEGIQIIARNFNLTPDETKAQLKTLKWLDYQKNILYFSSRKKPNAEQVLQDASHLWFKLGIIKQHIDAKKLIDATLLRTLYITHTRV